jgi:general secretion pathway protein D
VEQAIAARESDSRSARALRKPLGIELREATLKQAFELVGRAAELNILLDKDVKSDQRVSLQLKDSSVEAALQYLLMSNQLEQQRLDANTLLVYPNNAAKLRDYQQLVVRTFVLANANAKAVADMIKTIVKSRDVVVDEKLNMVILRDSPEAVRTAEKLVALQDVAEPEVVLDVEILEVTRDRLLELGVAWPGQMSLTPLAAGGGALTVDDLRRLRNENIGVAVDPVKINARAVDGDTNLLANPRIRVLNREKARVVIGNKVPSVTVNSVPNAGLVSDSVNYLDVGLKLEVEPYVFVNDDVAIRMNLEVSNIVGTQTTKQGTVTYTIGTRAASTMLRLRDGENQVLAGLINDEDRRSANKVPGLGELPLAGRLFGSTLADGKKTEIVLSITPRLVRNVRRPGGEAAEFATGTEASWRHRPPPAASAAEAQQSAAATAAEAQKSAAASAAAQAKDAAGAGRPAAAASAAQ